MPIFDPDAKKPASNTIKMVWVTSIAHIFYTNPNISLSVPASWAPYISAISVVMFLLAYGISGFVTWVIASGITKDRLWARATFIVLILLSLPTRISSLFYSNSMFDAAKFRMSFFIILAWCVADVVLAYSLCSPSNGAQTETSS